MSTQVPLEKDRQNLNEIRKRLRSAIQRKQTSTTVSDSTQVDESGSDDQDVDPQPSERADTQETHLTQIRPLQEEFVTLLGVNRTTLSELSALYEDFVLTQQQLIQQKRVVQENQNTPLITQIDELERRLQYFARLITQSEGEVVWQASDVSELLDTLVSSYSQAEQQQELGTNSDEISSDIKHNYQQLQNHKTTHSALLNRTLRRHEELKKTIAEQEATINEFPEYQELEPIDHMAEEAAPANVPVAALLAQNLNVDHLPKFGEDLNDDVQEFLQKLELSLNFFQLENDQKAKLVPLLLRGRAYTFYASLPNETKTDYAQLTNALTEEFNPVQLQYRKRQELYSVQQKGQPIAVYLAKVEKLAQNLAVPDQTKIDLMIAGLDQGYRQYIQMKQPTTFREASHALLLKESISPPEETDVLKSVLETVTAIKNNQQSSRPSVHKQYNQQRDSKQIICFRCMEPGHYKSQCPQIKTE